MPCFWKAISRVYFFFVDFVLLTLSVQGCLALHLDLLSN